MIYLDQKANSNTVHMEKKTVRNTRVTLVSSGILLLLFGVVITVLAVNVPEISASRSFGSFLLKSGCAAAFAGSSASRKCAASTHSVCVWYSG